MRVAHIVCTYPPYYGGMGNVTFHMAEELLTRGHDVVVFTPEYSREKDASAEIQSAPSVSQVERLHPRLSYGNGALLPDLYKKLKDFDVVHLHYPFFGVAGGVARFKKQHPEIPLVVTYHMDTRAPGWLGLYMAWYAKWWLPRILGRADQITVSSFDYAEHSDAAGLLAQDRTSWVEIPFGVDTERFHPENKDADMSILQGWSRDIPLFLFVGGMDAAHHFKGVSVFLKALQQLKQKGIPFGALFVGDGDLRADYMQEASFRGLDAQVHFAGYVDDADLPRYYASADVTVLPSVHQGEAFGMVLLESMASGTAVIASDLPGVRTVAEHGGVVVEPKDSTALAMALQEIIPQAEMLGAAGRRAVEEKYTWHAVGDQLEALYHSLVKTR